METIKKQLFSYIASLILLLSCGCGTETAPLEETTLPYNDASIPVITASPLMETTDHSTPAFVLSNMPLAVEEYLPISLTDAPQQYDSMQFYTESFGNKLYILADYLFASGQHAFRFYIFDSNTKEIQNLDFFMDHEDWRSFTILSMDIVDSDTLSFRLSCHKADTGEQKDILYQTNLSGKCIDMQEPFPRDKDTYPWNTEIGNLHTYTFPDDTTYLTDWNNTDSTASISTYNKETHKQEPVLELSSTFIHSLTKDAEDNLYYVANGYITHYNPTTQAGMRICSLSDCGISILGELDLLINDQNQLALVSVYNENPGIYFLAPKNQITTDTENTLRIANLYFIMNDYVANKSAILSNTSPSIHIELEQPAPSLADDKQAREAFHDRIMMEIVAGGGPDLLWVSRDDMNTLAEKGALMDMETLLPAEVLEQMLPGILDLRVNGTLVGITPEVSFHTMAASNKCWEKDSWTIDEFLSIAETSDAWKEPVVYASYKLDYFSLLGMALLRNPEDYIDYKTKTSHFNDETFLRIMEYCKKYGQGGGYDTITKESGNDFLKTGESYAKIQYFYNGFADFSSFMTRQSSYAHIVGYPGLKGSHHYIYSDGYLVVNANTVHVEEIKELLAYLFSYENQFTISRTPVRKDVICDRIIKDAATRKDQVLLSLDGDMIQQIDTKPDGNSWIEEFMDFAESAILAPTDSGTVQKIINSELRAYFNSDKSAKETIEIIQNRVQLYLDEMK